MQWTGQTDEKTLLFSYCVHRPYPPSCCVFTRCASSMQTAGMLHSYCPLSLLINTACKLTYKASYKGLQLVIRARCRLLTCVGSSFVVAKLDGRLIWCSVCHATWAWLGRLRFHALLLPSQTTQLNGVECRIWHIPKHR